MFNFIYKVYNSIQDSIRENCIDYIWSFIWTLLILFFAYAPDMQKLLKSEAVINEVYFGAQSSFFSMVINLGIIVMILFDIKHKEFQNISFKWVVFSFIVIILIYGHAMNIADVSKNKYHLVSFLSCQEIGFIIGGFFIWFATHIKFLSKKHLEYIENKSKSRTATLITT